MNNFTTDLHETKREIELFSNKMGKSLSKPVNKFIFDLQYGMAASQSTLVSEISRKLMEPIKLKHTIERICDNARSMNEDERETINNNYMNEVLKYIPEEPLILLDDTEIVKPYGKKFEDLCKVRDASSLSEEIKPGYHVSEAVVVSKRTHHPIPIYSHVYSTESDDFKSMPTETLKSIKFAKKHISRRCTFSCDRGYDNNTYFKFFLVENEGKDDFVIRLKDNRSLLFKGKSKNVGTVAKTRKGKVKMNLMFSNNEVITYLSHTKVSLPILPNIPLTLVIVYGLSDENPMILLTNKMISCKEDAIRVVRCYMSRWRIEENFREKKQEYEWENIRVRNLNAINSMNLMLMLHIGHISMLADRIDDKLLVIKIIERSKSLRNNVQLWGYQIARGLSEILSHAQCGIKNLQQVEHIEEYKQISFNI